MHQITLCTYIVLPGNRKQTVSGIKWVGRMTRVVVLGGMNSITLFSLVRLVQTCTVNYTLVYPFVEQILVHWNEVGIY